MIDDPKVLETINDVVEDIKLKIVQISDLVDMSDPSKKIKISNVANKTIAVLNSAIQKISDARDTVKDPNELLNGVEVLKEKSKLLFDNATNKINEILLGVDSIKSEKIIDRVKKEPKSNGYKSIENCDEFTKKALSTLRDWLKPSGDE